MVLSPTDKNGLFVVFYNIFFNSIEKVPKKKDLLSLLNPIEYMWDIIGELLGVKYGKIKSSQYEETYNTRRLSDVLQSWIDGKPSEVSWKMVITVVEKPPVENKVVAEAITHFLSRPDTQSRYCSFNQSESGIVNDNLFSLIFPCLLLLKVLIS